MQMMYSIVAQELREMQVDAHPQDYLSFFCLGKREEAPKDVSANNGDKVFTEENSFCSFIKHINNQLFFLGLKYNSWL